MKGLGDVVEKVAKVTGIAAAVKSVAGDNCGCAARRDALNRVFPFNKEEDNKIQSSNDIKKMHKMQ
ncbi:MAG: hypothetical protein RIR23_1000 [Pseudomonadota bacterium]|jgi:hypothetical protein